MTNSRCCCVLLLSITYTLLRCCDSETVRKKKVLHLLSLLPYFNEDSSLNPSWSEADNIAPALQLAEDQVNAHPNILQGHRLEVIRAQAGCQLVSKTIVSFVEEVYHSPRRRIAGIIGPGCSSSSIALASITNRSAVILVMLHGSGSPTLADRKKYPYHLGTLGSTGNFVSAIQYLLQNWKRVAILYDVSRHFYKDTVKQLIEKLKYTRTKVEYLSPVNFNFLPLSVIREQLLRIVLVMCPPQLSRYLICLSLRRNMTYNNYQWVYMAHEENVLVSQVEFSYDKERITCSEAEMADALSYQILLVYSLTSSKSSVLEPLNITYQDYLKKYDNYIKKYNARGDVIGKNSTYSDWTSYFYDSVWAWALVLDNLTKMNPELFNNSRSLYGNVVYANLTMEQFFNTRFEGISGPISYDRSTGFTPRTVNLIQISSDGEVKMRGKLLVRIHSSANRDVISEPIQISDSFHEEHVRENKHLARFFISVVISLFVMTLSLHMLTCVNVKQPTIKATTPKLLHLSYVGVYIMLLGIFIYTLYPAVPLALELRGIFCQVYWNWTIPIGFTLSMGPVAMRTWRLYRIFLHYLNPGPFITNTVLVSAVLVMLMMDILLAVIWRTLDSIQTEIFKEKHFQSKLGVKIVWVQAVCTSTMYNLWILLLIIDKLLLLGFVTILVFLTRNIRNLSFTTNSLRVLTYVISIITVLGFSLHFLLSSTLDPNYDFTVLSVTTISIISVFLVCVLVPPLLPIFKNYYRRLENNCSCPTGKTS